MSSPAVSVIMPCYNAAAHVRASVASALGQSESDIELIVVDDGSTDRSAEILAHIPDTRLRVIRQENRGVCAARNRGLEAARGEFVAFLDADDTWEADCLEKLRAALVATPDAALAYCGWRNLGLPGGRGKPFVPPDYEGRDKIADLFRNCRWPIHACLARRAAVIDAGGFDERYVTSEDYLLWLKIAAQRRIVRVPAVLAYYHFHGAGQATGNRLRLAHNHWLIQQEFLRRNPWLAKQLGTRRVRELTHGELLKKALACYWDGELASARTLFRIVMRAGYGRPRDWKLMLPALLPLRAHRAMLRARNAFRGQVNPHV